MNKAIVLDVDCVLLDFYTGFEEQASNFLGRKLKAVGTIYNLINRYNLHENELKGIFKHMLNNFDDFPLLEGADEAFNRLKEAGYKIHLVTSILPELEVQRLYNLKKYDIYPDSIDCVSNESKDSYIRQYNPIAMVDDRIENLYTIADSVPHRVLINNGDDQTGFENMRIHVTHETSSLNKWIIANPQILQKENRRFKMR